MNYTYLFFKNKKNCKFRGAIINENCDSVRAIGLKGARCKFEFTLVAVEANRSKRIDRLARRETTNDSVEVPREEDAHGSAGIAGKEEQRK